MMNLPRLRKEGGKSMSLNISIDELLDLIERAHNSGCLREVIKMVKSGSPKVMIEKVISECEREIQINGIDWIDLFGAD